jgi:membrane-associated protease RseP (regulator of RpoE activity)
VDGDDFGALGANTTKKLQMSRGEHLVTALCGGAPWKQVLSVGPEQKVVSISFPSATTAPAAAAPFAAATGGTGVARVLDRSGRLVVGAVVKDSPAWIAGVRAGSIIVSVNGKRAQEMTVEGLGSLDEGPAGSSLSAEILTLENEFKKVSIVRATVPAAGIMQVVLPDGKTIQEKTFTAANYQSVANNLDQFKPLATGFAPGTFTMTCQKCSKKARVGGSLYCEDHKCQHPGCTNLEAWPSDYCWLHKGLHD